MKTAAITSDRRPRFGELVLLDEEHYRVCALVVSPTRGCWIRPEGAEDASGDRVFALGDLTWNRAAERWEAV
jgi:hypothetical protein